MASKPETRIVLAASEAHSIKTNLQRVQEELLRVRDKAREEADALDRIRGMIDLKYLNDLIAAIDALEKRVKAMESGTQDSQITGQLQAEQQRLAKLWDAFKVQEDELNKMQIERDSLLKRLEEMEADFRGLGNITQARAKLSYLETENKRLTEALSKTSARADESRELFEAEQQRLAKLYKVFEDQAASLESFSAVEAKWHAWRQKYWPKLPADARNAGDRIRKAK